MMLSRSLIEQILLGPMIGMRFTQDSAILPEVWLAFAAEPGRRSSLLLTPFRNDSSGRLARRIAAGLEGNEANGNSVRDVAYIDAVVAVDLTLDEVLRFVLPITQWWEQHATKLREKRGADWLSNAALAGAVSKVLADPDGRALAPELPDDIARILVLVALILLDRQDADDRRRERARGEARPRRRSIEERLNSSSGRRDVIRRASELLVNAHWTEELRSARAHEERSFAPTHPAEFSERVFLVSLNRPVFAATERSVPAIKADAAMRLFRIDCSALTWAVIDSGIDAQHPAFSLPEGSRVREIYDFSRIRSILSIDRIFSDSDRSDLIAELAQESGLPVPDVERRLAYLRHDVDLSRMVDWNLVGPLLKRPLNTPPYSDHGTHVAGVLGAKEVPEEGMGVCPDIQLLDIRVLSATIEDMEFAVVAALQFVRYLNETSGYMAVHGVNMSLSIPHDIRNYACGRTPVCEEAARLCASGVVVVAAAGNLGWQSMDGEKSAFSRYNAISITDPGNAEAVITVGSTHRFRPHSYGVSYFSSRGPTGDGRNKPDLVAPGEKIRSTLPDGEWGTKDGTSMAAPHVSGAAALLMGRYNELIGDPARIKHILCESATDLGRERYFQGAGMLDVLRALQSI
jgi:serine protease AprX